MTTYELVVVIYLIVGDPLSENFIATCNLRILINIIWLSRYTATHIYTIHK